MKNAQRNLATFAVVITLAFTFLAVQSMAQNQKSSVPTQKELVTLLKTAQEPPEHRRIAAYYRAEAVRLDESANEHAELLNIYQQPHPSKQQTMVGQEATHCQKLVELTKEQAKEVRALAVLHDEMATAAEQKQK
jgi:hypothetical protein